MIEWIKPTRGNRTGRTAFMALSVTSAGANKKHKTNQLVIRFGTDACKELRLIAGDRMVIGIDRISKQVCFKRTSDNTGYKLSGKSGSSLTVQASMNLPIFPAQSIDKDALKIEATHMAITCPSFFKDCQS